MSHRLVGESASIQELKRLIAKVAPTQTNILILGESGTGKELVARLVHDLGPVKNQAFVPINCGAIPENLIESELFGHQKGSFTGAVADKMGLFQLADGGTLFLDEVGELPLSMQVKLLRAIQDRSFRRVGGIEDIQVDVRMIAATNRNLEDAVKKGTFREDLYYRLNVIVIKTPPLRVRKDDISLLARHFLQKYNQKTGRNICDFQALALRDLVVYHWPGNVRELENTVERAVALESGQQILRESLPDSIRGCSDGVSKSSSQASSEIQVTLPNFVLGEMNLDQVMEEIERAYLLAALAQAKGVQKTAAKYLGLTLRNLQSKIIRFKIT